MHGIENFKLKNLLCKCKNPGCSGKDPGKLSDKLIFQLQLLRYTLNSPIVVSRCLVCLEHHYAVYKKKYGAEWERFVTHKSTHLTGEGADIYVRGLSMTNLYLAAEKIDHIGMGFSGLGLYSDHIHADVSQRRIARWVCKQGIYTFLF